MATGSTTSWRSRSISSRGQTRIVTIAYGDAAAIQRLRTPYPKRTAARFAAHYEGPGWESETTAWRIYFDARNAIDLWGKRRPGLYLELFASPEYGYHEESPLGRDIYGIGKALGVAGIGAVVDGKVTPVAEVAGRKWRIVADGAGALDRRARVQGLEDRRPYGGPGQPHHPVGGRARVRTPHHGRQRGRRLAGDRNPAEARDREPGSRRAVGSRGGHLGTPGGGRGNEVDGQGPSGREPGRGRDGARGPGRQRQLG